jgi:hypothetical protein
MMICEAYAKTHGWAPTVARISDALFPCFVLVCKPKAAVVASKTSSGYVGVLWTGFGAMSKKAPFNAVGIS